ncbi:MAG: hypothetical protein BWX88_03450 [Planctomycetes bacterium ADurb.Bin126]|nr:MAG: hypothetical protein BWX88_03450 [Planctomycetes bacterium ADurb.Bin126]
MTGAEDSSMNSSPGAANTAAPAENQAANPAALTVEQLARLLGIDAEKVLDHVAAGAPVGPGQRVNLVHYAAWLNKEMGRTDGD